MTIEEKSNLKNTVHFAEDRGKYIAFRKGMSFLV
jgi:hypothetical protein